jgi:hypothetical protein
MMPFDQVAALYGQFECSRTFDEDICAHIETGYVVSTPEHFLMGRAVDRYADPALIVDPWHSFPVVNQNAWLCYAFAGCQSKLLTLAPFPLTWVGWQRRGKSLRWYRTEHFNRVCYTLTRSSITG